MKSMVLLTWHYSDSTLFINLCFARTLSGMYFAKVRSNARNCKAHHIFLMAISMHSDPLSPSHNSPILKAARVFISTGVIGVNEHSADSRLFLFLYRCQAWVGGVFQSFSGTMGPVVLSFYSQERFLTLIFCICLFLYLSLILTSVIAGQEIALIFKAVVSSVRGQITTLHQRWILRASEVSVDLSAGSRFAINKTFTSNITVPPSRGGGEKMSANLHEERKHIS